MSLQTSLTFVVVILVTVFCSCKHSSKTEARAFKTIEEGMTNMNQMTDKASETIYASLEDRALDPLYSTKAKVWLSRAILVRTYTEQMIQYLEELKRTIKKQAGFEKDPIQFYRNDSEEPARAILIENGKGVGLFDSMNKYKQNLLHINVAIEKEFSQHLILIDTEYENDEEKFPLDFFTAIRPAEAIILLSQFENNVKQTEKRVLAFCNEQVIYDFIDERNYTSYEAIIGQSSSYVRSGQKIEIVAGVGTFSRVAQPQITINGKKIELVGDGTAHYTFSASAKPGKHRIPAKIEFTDQDGKIQTLVKTIEYTVAEEK